MEYKKVSASETVKTRDINAIAAKTGNIYESVVVCAKRSQQLNADLKRELTDKLSSFASYTDSLEEIHENREQIEVSKYYEKLPKPALIALEELLANNIYFTQEEPSNDYPPKKNKNEK